MKNYKLSILVVVAMLLGGCHEIFDCERGTGPTVSKTLLLEDFHSFELKGSSNVYLTQGEQQEVTVEGQENIIELLELDVHNGNWEIEFMECIRSHDELTFYITIPEVRSMTISGSGQIKTQNIIQSENLEMYIFGSGDIDANLDAANLKGKITGSGDMKLSGQADFTDLGISGSGDFRAFDLFTKVCDVEISGSGNTRIYCEDELDVKISGSGNVYYEGTPSINASVSGSGNIFDAN